jgi:hypothetical protein
MNRSKIKRTVVALAILGAGMAATQVRAASAPPVLDFGMVAPTPGTLSYSGGINPLVGTNIEVDEVVGLSTPSNDGVIKNCTGCTLNFTTGNEDGSGTWNFTGGGTITVTGSVDDVTAGPNLLAGSFTSASIKEFDLGLYKFEIAGAGFTDTKDTDLLDFYGLPSGDYGGGLNLSFLLDPSITFGSAFSVSGLASGDIVNSPVPIPPAVLLFGAGLVGLVTVARRRNNVDGNGGSLLAAA